MAPRARRRASSAPRSRQFALTFEPTNEVFKEWLEKAKAARGEQKKDVKQQNAYKIRI